ncbi:uracil-DNA glycosylase [Ottowia thiooxydans]|uniref:uracil-DNA glycosylase n=1 Tax=Ottowia thiooxydans TaxID=219182 RepID=UPI00041E6AA8|nr:uracil-DNA glycosylase [Ottowia thiooxydans]
MAPPARERSSESLSLFSEAQAGVERLREWPIGIEQIASGWRPVVNDFLQSDAGRRLDEFLRERIAADACIYPPQPLRALTLTPPEAVHVVILGQDPYHGAGQANGLAFDVAPGIKLPPSLRNIHKELALEYGRSPKAEGLLEHWARQGVLLLNTCLTVEDGQPASHARLGWQTLTTAIFNQLVESDRPLAFLLWGAHAQAKAPEGELGQEAQDSGLKGHLWLMANHPSPLSALRPPVPFMGCGHFKRANDFLASHGLPIIDWLGDEENIGKRHKLVA